MSKTITAHCLVKNEARYVWFSVMSVINHVDKVLLWDTGSTDGTLEIIDAIRKTKDGQRKIEFREYGPVTPGTFAKVRQEMLDATKTDWFLMVDGDEVWWEDSIRHLVSVVNEKGDSMESIVVPTVNLVGDIYHYQDQSGGQYHLAGRKGHLNLRGINRKISGLHSFGPHGQWGWTDAENTMIQYRDQKKIVFIDAPYLHATNVPRAGEIKKETDVPKRAMKRKYELGMPFPADFYYPEVFFRPKPDVVPSPWAKVDYYFKVRSAIETPLRRLKRKFIPAKVGY